MIRRLNVYEAVQERLRLVFENFDYVYVSFSGGKDSGVLLNLCVDYIRKHLPGRKLGVFHMDYEAQYSQTTEYVKRRLAQDTDILEVYHCCLPFKVATCTSMYQSYWRPWEDSKKRYGCGICPKVVTLRRISGSSTMACGITIFRAYSLCGCVGSKGVDGYVVLWG